MIISDFPVPFKTLLIFLFVVDFLGMVFSCVFHFLFFFILVLFFLSLSLSYLGRDAAAALPVRHQMGGKPSISPGKPHLTP